MKHRFHGIKFSMLLSRSSNILEHIGFQIFRLRTCNTSSHHTSPVISLETVVYWLWMLAFVCSRAPSQPGIPLHERELPLHHHCLPSLQRWHSLPHWGCSPYLRGELGLFTTLTLLFCTPSCVLFCPCLPFSETLNLSVLGAWIDLVVFEWCCQFFQRPPRFFKVRNPQSMCPLYWTFITTIEYPSSFFF